MARKRALKKSTRALPSGRQKEASEHAHCKADHAAMKRVYEPARKKTR